MLGEVVMPSDAAEILDNYFDDEDYDSLINELAFYNDHQFEFNWWDRLGLFQTCAVDVLWQTAMSSRFVILAALLCHVVSSFVAKSKPAHPKNKPFYSEMLPLLFHISLGISAIYVHYDYNLLPVITMFGEALGFHAICNLTEGRSTIRAYLCLGFISACTCLPELIFVDGELWHSIRGCHMILAMKLISLMDDTNAQSSDPKGCPEKADFLSYLAYCSTPSTVIYGPWISYGAFINSIKASSFNIQQWIHIAKNVIYGSVCLICSTCAVNGILVSDEDLTKHMIAARDSYSFILSHFFISYLSTVIATSGGIRSVTLDKAVNSSYLVVSKPFDVLVPHSLTQLVIAWSIPMHTWLRRYVFKPMYKNFGPLAGILATYSASALLHGFNGQIAFVLLTIGVFTFVEFKFRSRLAKTFDACVGSKACEDNERPQDQVCHHKYDLDHAVVRTVNVAFSFYAVALFAYATACFGGDSEVGSQLDGYSLLHVLTTWSKLGWFGHVACFVMFVFDTATR